MQFETEAAMSQMLNCTDWGCEYLYFRKYKVIEALMACVIWWDFLVDIAIVF